jgi:hypothetical protein
MMKGTNMIERNFQAMSEFIGECTDAQAFTLKIAQGIVQRLDAKAVKGTRAFNLGLILVSSFAIGRDVESLATFTQLDRVEVQSHMRTLMRAGWWTETDAEVANAAERRAAK